jgi:peptidoglycan/xylan/chitin deacetylase (PgdA/CDA1 family)
MASPFRIGLIFHGIGIPGRVLEPGEAPYWLSTEKFVSILDRIAASPHREAFFLSFDDGNCSDHDIALPCLAARGLVADFFVLTGRIGRPGSLSPDQVLALQAAGMRIGSHGIGHRNLRHLSDTDLLDELSGSRATLEQLCGLPIATLGLPFGAYDRRVLQAARAAGYQAVYSSDRGRMRSDRFLRPRSSVSEAMTPQEIEDILSARLAMRARLSRAAGMARRRFMS